MKNIRAFFKDPFTREALKMTIILTSKSFAYLVASVSGVLGVFAIFGAFHTPLNLIENFLMPIILAAIAGTAVYLTREARRGGGFR